MVVLVGRKKKDAADPSVMIRLADQSAQDTKNKHLVRAAGFGQLGSALDAASQSSVVSGKNLYMFNGIPVEALLEILKNDTETTNAAFSLYGNTALLKGGLAASDNGTITSTGDSLAVSEANFVISAGEQDAQSTRLDGIEGLSQGLTMFAGEVGSALTKPSVQEEEDNVDKIQNALDYEKTLSSGATHLADGEMDAVHNQDHESYREDRSVAMRKAIQELSGGSYDVTEGENHFGSTARTNSKGKVTGYEKDADEVHIDNCEIDTGATGTVKVKDALRHATDEQRSEIRETLQKQLVDAKKARREKRAHVASRKKDISDNIQRLGNAAASTAKLSKAGNVLASAQAQAQRTIIQNENSTVQSIQKAQNDGIDSAKKKGQTTQDLLREMYAQLGKRG